MPTLPLSLPSQNPLFRHFPLAFACFAFGAILTGAPAPDPSVSPERLARLERLVRNFDPVRDRTGVRALFEFALEAADAGWRPDLVERAFEIAEQMQDRDPASPTFGNFRWYMLNEKVEDRNAVQFSMERASLLWMLRKDRLTPLAHERLERLIEFSVEGIRRHRVRESYTNIYLMKTWNCIALGEATGRPELAEEGYAMFERWFEQTLETGITEYLSPTYYGVDLGSLGLIARFAGKEEWRGAAETALRLFWTDVALNWFAPAQRLGGAHGRDYDYLRGTGSLDSFLRRHSWLRDGEKIPELDLFERSSDWTPPAELRKLAGQTPRTVTRRWGAEPWKTATHYVGRSFSLGVANASYGPEDKPFSLDLSSTRKDVLVRFFMDARGDPYGQIKFPQGMSGHMKAQHLVPFLASVQRGPEVLFLASADPAFPEHFRHAPEPACLLSHFFFPDAAEVWIGETRLPALRGQRHDVPDQTPVFLRHGGVAAGIRFPLARTDAGGKARIFLAGDGEKFGAARLSVEHAAQAPQSRGVVAAWVRVAEDLDDAAFTAFRKSFAAAQAEAVLDGDRARVKVAGAAEPMAIEADLASGQRLLRTGGEPEDDAALLGLNGRDIGREILGSAPFLKKYEELLAAAESGRGDVARPGTVLEAEGASRVLPEFRIGSDPAASGGKFLWAPGEPGEGGGGSGSARWLLHVPSAGRYALWGRVQAPTSSDDSFFVKFKQTDGPAMEPADWHTGVRPAWTWVALTDLEAKNKKKPLLFELAKGGLWLEVSCREDGARLDSLYLAPESDPGPPVK